MLVVSESLVGAEVVTNEDGVTDRICQCIKCGVGENDDSEG